MKADFLRFHRAPNRYEQQFISQVGPLLSKEEFNKGLKIVRASLGWAGSELEKKTMILKATVWLVLKKSSGRLIPWLFTCSGGTKRRFYASTTPSKNDKPS